MNQSIHWSVGNMIQVSNHSGRLVAVIDKQGLKQPSRFLGYDIPLDVEHAIYAQDWMRVRGWAVTTAVESGDVALVGQVQWWIENRAKWLRP